MDEILAFIIAHPFISSMIGLAALGLLTAGRDEFNEIVETGSDFLNGSVGKVELQIKDWHGNFNGTQDEAETRYKALLKSIAELLRYFQTGFQAASAFLGMVVGSMRHILDETNTPGGLAWSVFGSQLFLIGWLALLYGDAIMTAHTLSLIFPGMPIAEEFLDLGTGFLAAFAGSLFSLSMVLIDALTITKLAPYHQKITNKWVRGAIIVALTLLLGSLISMAWLLAQARLCVVTGEVGDLCQQNMVYAAYAQSNIIVPMYLVTLIMGWGVVGLIVYAAIPVLIVLLAFKITEFVLGGVIRAFDIGDESTLIVLKVTFMLLGMVFGVAGHLVSMVGQFIVMLAKVIKSVLEFITLVPLAAATMLNNLLHLLIQYLRRKTQPVPPSYPPTNGNGAHRKRSSAQSQKTP